MACSEFFIFFTLLHSGREQYNHRCDPLCFYFYFHPIVNFFFLSYETGDGSSAQAQGVLKNAGTPDAEAQEVTGSYSYTALDGTKVQISYIANENGYQPTGDGIPAIPPAIQRALEYIAAHPEPNIKQKK